MTLVARLPVALRHSFHAPFSAFRTVGALLLAGFLLTSGLAADVADPVVELEDYPVYTATRTPRALQDLPIRTEVISSRLLRSGGIRDFSDAVQYINALRTESNCQNCGAAEIKMLGLGAGYTLVLFDGYPLFSGLASVYGVEQIPAGAIDQLEIVKGGGSALYGSSAVAGVVNIISHIPRTSRGEFKVYAEDFRGGGSLLSGEVLGDYKGEMLSVSAYGLYRDRGALELNGDGFTEVSEQELSVAGVNGIWQISEAGNFDFSYGFTNEYRRGGDDLDITAHLASVAETTDQDWHRAIAEYNHRVHDDLDWRVGYALSYIERDSFYGALGDITPEDPAYAATVDENRRNYGYTEETRWFLEGQVNYRIGHHHLTVGLHYEYSDLFDEKRDDEGQSLRRDGTLATATGEDPIAEEDFDNFAIFVQDEWEVSSFVTVVGGLRVDDHSLLADPVWSPRLLMRYDAFGGVSFRAGVSTGFRAPEVFDEDFHIEVFGDPRRTRNAPGLSEEKSVSYSAGVTWQPAAQEGRLTLEGDLYYTTIEDTFVANDLTRIDPETGEAFVERINGSDSSVFTAEFNLDYEFAEGWDLRFGVAYTDAAFDEPEEIIAGVFRERYLETPEWTGLAVLTWTDADIGTVTAGINYTGSMIAINEEEGFVNDDTDTFWVIDVGYQRVWDNAIDGALLGVSVGVRNLLDDRQDDLPVGAGRDPGYLYGPRFPRSFYVQLDLDF